MEQIDNEIAILDEKDLSKYVYIIRGQQVMLDFDLARYYGYETKRFNEQVKRNIVKFPKEFRFRLTSTEVNNLVMSKISTSRNANYFTGQSGGTRKLPYAFTEQGIYMLISVLKGEKATKQSIALIKLFKVMKDYIQYQNLLPLNEVIALTNQTNQNTNDIVEIKEELGKQSKQLEVVMENFVDPSKYKEFLIKNNQRIEADIAFQDIYKTAKESIVIIDDYISVKTLNNLKVINTNVKVTIVSDNVSRTPLNESEIDDFIKDKNINISLINSHKLFHNRYIVIDYNTDNETIFDCGPSSKDAGNSIATIHTIEFPHLYHEIFDKVFYEK